MKRFAAGCLALALAIGPAGAEDLVTALSTGWIAVTSNFTGATVTVFGTVERDTATVARPGGYDVVVSVRGPNETVTTWRKERVLGLWVNYGAERHVNVPAYYVALSNRPIGGITGLRQRKESQIGFEGLRLPVTTETLQKTLEDFDAFADAFLRLKVNQGLYREIPEGVEFLSPSLFRAAIPIPAHAPIGQYKISIHLFADGALLKSRDETLVIAKEGFEYAIVTLASRWPVTYGLITLTIAFFVGWLANVLFRRD